jgi:hypothetical protein
MGYATDGVNRGRYTFALNSFVGNTSCGFGTGIKKFGIDLS